MNAICILICLALARHTCGSIFRHQRMEPDTLVEPRNYNAHFQQALYEDQKVYPNYKYGYHSHSSQESSQQTKTESSESDEHTRGIFRTRNKNKKSPYYLSVMKVNNVMGPSYSDSKVWTSLKDPKDYNNENTPKPQNPNIPTTMADPIAAEQEIDEIFGGAQMTMKQFTEEDKMKFHEQVTAALNQDKVENHLNTAELLVKYQYPTEIHTAKTDDGYELTLFRIPSKTPTDKVVMLMHGLLGSSDDWVLLGPQKSLAYQLADAGFDVWLGNTRGNKYSQKHISKHPAMDDFWTFSNDEIAQIDIPTMIDFILKTTKQDKLHYIGHSQGNTNAIALIAEQPWYGEKIWSLHALAPMVFMGNARSPLLRLMASPSPVKDIIKTQMGKGAFTPNKELISKMGGALCDEEIGCRNVCSNVNFAISGVNIEELDPETVPSILAHSPGGTSTRVMDHYSQGVASQEFKKYDHGAEINEKIYGTPEPPNYELRKVKTPVWLYYAEDDWLSDPTDVERLKEALPNVVEWFKMPHKHFTHLDFVFSKNVWELLNKKIIDSIQNM